MLRSGTSTQHPLVSISFYFFSFFYFFSSTSLLYIPSTYLIIHSFTLQVPIFITITPRPTWSKHQLLRRKPRCLVQRASRVYTISYVTSTSTDESVAELFWKWIQPYNSIGQYHSSQVLSQLPKQLGPH
ncbi:hypothetical protein BDW60DRAFT_83262 [Aspergillus nidulans var. acristatus]